MTCLCTGRPPCWVCDDGPTPHDLALADAIERRANEVYPEDIFRVPDSEKCAEMHAVIREHFGHGLDGFGAMAMRFAHQAIAAELRRDGLASWRDDGQDHHQTHGNGPVSAEERQSGLGDDGLTDEERQEFLSEFQRGIGSKRINDGATGAERGELVIETEGETK